MGDEVEMVDAADDEIAPRGMIDLPNEILGKILNQLRPKKERGKVRLLSRSLRSRVNTMDPRYNRYKIKLEMKDLPENELFYEDTAEVDLDLNLIDHNDPKMEKLAIWLEKSSHRLTKLKGSPVVLNQVATGYVVAPRLIKMEIMGLINMHRALNNPWAPSLHTLWLECVDLRISPDQTINMPNLKVLHLRDVVMVNPNTGNTAAFKKLKTDNLGLVTILNGCRTTLEFLELYTINLSGMVHFKKDLPMLKKIKLVRSNDEEGLKALFEACKTSLETLVHQEMVMHCFQHFSTHMECLKTIDTENDINGVTLIEKCASTLENLDLKSFDGTNNFVGFTTPFPALKSIKSFPCRGSGRLGLGVLVALSCQTLESLCIERVNLYNELRNINYELPRLKTLYLDKCEGDGIVIELLRASRHSIETLEAESLNCRFPSSINFDMPNLKFIKVGSCKRDVMRALEMRCHPDVKVYRSRYR